MRKILIITIVLAFSLVGLGQTKVQPLNFNERTLDNGLKVVSLQDNSSPTVSIQVWYDVGGKNDPEGKSGFAHMFEHMMFKSTKNMPSEKLDRLTEDVGGWNNASTWDDLTNYYEVVPSNYLETLLWAEAERMVNLQVDADNFSSERDVVKEEYRQGVLARPYGRLFQYLDSLSFSKHPYKRGVIGNIDELNAASLEDAEKFYKTYYRPDNAALVVVGDFDQKQLDAWVDKYFGKIKKPEGEIPRVNVTEPDRTKEVRYVKTAPNVPLPALGMTFLAPPSSSKDVPALQIAESILSGGESARLYQSLIREKQLASTAFFNADIRKDKGLLYFFVVSSAGKDLADIEKAVMDEVAKLQAKPPTGKEVEKAKNKIITGILQQRETNFGKGIAIGRALIFDKDPSTVNSDIAKLQAVTVKDVQEVMKKYFDADKKVVIYYQNEEEKKGEKENVGK